jgi:hypothetical protein
MQLAHFILMGAGAIALLGALILLVCKSMLESIANLEEDDEGVFHDKRDMI